jgi:N-methylhydantoinase B
MERQAKRPDMITAEIIRNGMTSAALEMARTLRLTAYSSALFESQDFGVGIVSPDGLLWGEAPGVAVFVGSMSDTVKTGIEAFGAGGFDEGDVLIVNDPDLSGTHLSDMTVYLPIFFAGGLVAFATATAHWADVGGIQPGGCSPVSNSLFQEGLCLSHQKLIARGERDEVLWSVIGSNTRFPEAVLGDLEAKLAAVRQGAERVLGLCRSYGADVVADSMALVVDRTDAAVRRKIEEIPDGSYSASIRLDSDGVIPDEQVKLVVDLKVDGDRIVASFDGTDASRGGPVNMYPIVSKSCVRIALKALTMPTDATNEGHFLAMDFDLTPGSVLTAERPAPCDSYGYAATAVVELALRALSEAVPDWCPAGGSQFTAVSMSRPDPKDGEEFIFYDPIDHGTGGRSDEDGAVLNVLGNGDVPNTPVEVTESRYPVRVERFEYHPTFAGAGRRRGGVGVRRDYQILGPGVLLNVMIENTKDVLVKGSHGGKPGHPSEILMFTGTERETRVTGRDGSWLLGTGDRYTVLTSGGGGLGDPFTRSPADVLADVEAELLSAEDAEGIYGVGLVRSERGWSIDEEATERLRTAQPDREEPR